MSDTYDDVARRAYELFLARGGEHGRDMDDWLEAERLLTGNGTRARPTRQIVSDPAAAKTAARRRRGV